MNYKVDKIDSLSISIVEMLRKQLNEDEKIGFQDGIPTILKKTKIDTMLERIFNGRKK